MSTVTTMSTTSANAALYTLNANTALSCPERSDAAGEVYKAHRLWLYAEYPEMTTAALDVLYASAWEDGWRAGLAKVEVLFNRYVLMVKDALTTL